jgi:hypothetical protein
VSDTESSSRNGKRLIRRRECNQPGHPSEVYRKMILDVGQLTFLWNMIPITHMNPGKFQNKKLYSQFWWYCILVCYFSYIWGLLLILRLPYWCQGSWYTIMGVWQGVAFYALRVGGRLLPLWTSHAIRLCTQWPKVSSFWDKTWTVDLASCHWPGPACHPFCTLYGRSPPAWPVSQVLE